MADIYRTREDQALRDAFVDFARRLKAKEPAPRADSSLAPNYGSSNDERTDQQRADDRKADADRLERIETDIRAMRDVMFEAFQRGRTD